MHETSLITESYVKILTKLHIQMVNIKIVRDIPQKVPIFRRAHLAYHSTFTSVPRENIKAAKPSKKRFPLDVFPMFAGFVHIHRLNQPQPIPSPTIEPTKRQQTWEIFKFWRNWDLLLLCLEISAASLKLEVYPTRNQSHLREQRSNTPCDILLYRSVQRDPSSWLMIIPTYDWV